MTSLVLAFLIGALSMAGLIAGCVGVCIVRLRDDPPRGRAFCASVLRGLVQEGAEAILVLFEGQQIAISFKTLATSIERGHLCSASDLQASGSPRPAVGCDRRFN
jgi:hypothetical protein